MNELLSEKLSKYLETFENSVEKAVEFSGEQAPLVVQEYISWLYVDGLIHFVYTILWIVASMIMIHYAKKCFKRTRSDDVSNAEAEGLTVLCMIIYIVAILSPIFAVITNMDEIKTGIKAKVAPRVVILEKISELVNNKGNHGTR